MLWCRASKNKYSKAFRVLWTKYFLQSLTVTHSLVGVSCTEDTSKRKSAVDAANLCNNDSNKVFAGQCIPVGQRVVDGGDDLRERREPESPNPASAGGSPAGGSPAGGSPAGGSPAGGSSAGGSSAGGSPAGDSSAGGASAGGASAGDSSAGGASEVGAPETGAPAQERGLTPVRRTTTSSSASPAAVGPEKTKTEGEHVQSTITTLTFKKDSFIAIADKVVVGNCFIPVGTKIDFSGDAYKVSQFEKNGVKQTIAFEVVDVIYPANFTANCPLKGRDFLFLKDHGDFAKKEP